MLDAGISALEQQRFAYTAKGEGWKRSLATAWATRARWGKFALAGVGALVVAFGVYHFTVAAPRAREAAAIQRELTTELPRALRAEHDRVLAGTQEAPPRAEAARLLAEGEAAARAANLTEARARRTALNDLAARLAAAYTVRIVNRPGEPSAVWRVPAANPRARNYYLVVEAVDRDGRPVEVPYHQRGRRPRHTRLALGPARAGGGIRTRPPRQAGGRHHRPACDRPEGCRQHHDELDRADHRGGDPVMVSGVAVLQEMDQRLADAQREASAAQTQADTLAARREGLRSEEAEALRELARLRVLETCDVQDRSGCARCRRRAGTGEPASPCDGTRSRAARRARCA